MWPVFKLLPADGGPAFNMIKTQTIKKNSDFLRVYKKGRFYVGKFIVLYILANNLNVNRLGIAVSKKIGKSVRRNRIRRLIRESYRALECSLKDGLDFIIVARASEEMPEFSDVKKELRFLMKRLDAFRGLKEHG